MFTPADHDVDDRGLIAALVADGRPLLLFTGLSLLLSGAFALFLSATGHFLPHDIEFLGMLPEQLCKINECRIVHFMIHDRVSFGGSLIAIGSLYMWMAEFPLRSRQPWAWWLFLVSGLLGFSSFLAYLGYGYLDTWHGAATLACFHALSSDWLSPIGRCPRTHRRQVCFIRELEFPSFRGTAWDGCCYWPRHLVSSAPA